MFRRFLRSFSLPLAASLFFFIGCSEDDSETPTPSLEVNTVTDLATLADSVDRTTGAVIEVRPWTYYSLRTNEALANSDSNSTAWDIAIKGTTIRINNGISGPGEGLATVLEDAFENILEAPDDAEMESDNSTSDYAIATGSGNGWYNYNSSTNVISPIPGRTIVVKLGDGTGYAKIRILSYYRGAPAEPDGFTDEARVYTFDYVVNTDGTRRLN